MQRFSLLVVLCLFLSGAWLHAGSVQEVSTTRGLVHPARTLILVRHGEKGADDPRNPSLSEAGQKRAQELARVLGAAKVTHLFSTDYKRTQATLQPIADANSLEIASYNPRGLDELLLQVQQLPPGAVAVIAGHSNTTPGLFKSLTGDEATGLEEHPQYGKMLPENAYDRMFVVTLAESAGELACIASVEMRYGK